MMRLASGMSSRSQAIGIAVPVPALVRVTHDPRDALQPRDPAQHVRPPGRVLAHDLPLRAFQRALLAQHGVGHADLADVVQPRRELELAELLLPRGPCARRPSARASRPRRSARRCSRRACRPRRPSPPRRPRPPVSSCSRICACSSATAPSSASRSSASSSSSPKRRPGRVVPAASAPRTRPSRRIGTAAPARSPSAASWAIRRGNLRVVVDQHRLAGRDHARPPFPRRCRSAGRRSRGGTPCPATTTARRGSASSRSRPQRARPA